MKVNEVASICKAMGEVNRVMIIEALVQGEKCACDLLERLDISQSTLSYHMKALTSCDLVNTKIDGKWTYYSINCEKFKEFKEYLGHINCDSKGVTCSC